MAQNGSQITITKSCFGHKIFPKQSNLAQIPLREGYFAESFFHVWKNQKQKISFKNFPPFSIQTHPTISAIYSSIKPLHLQSTLDSAYFRGDLFQHQVSLTTLHLRRLQVHRYKSYSFLISIFDLYHGGDILCKRNQYCSCPVDNASFIYRIFSLKFRAVPNDPSNSTSPRCLYKIRYMGS